MLALTSGRYRIKWTQLADLPAPLYAAYVAVKHHKIYVTGGISPVEDAENQVYVYNTVMDQWGQLPPSGHYYGIPHVIGGRLAIIGGRLSATKKMTNKVSTFDEDSQTWASYYPDLLSVRSRPGVASHLEYVIVAGGGRPTAEDDETAAVQDDIEVLNWIKNLHWRKVSIKLPVPMFAFTPIISDNDLIIVGFANVCAARDKMAYKIKVADIIGSVGQQNYTRSNKWTALSQADHSYVALVHSSSSPLVIGGRDCINGGGTPTADIKMYDNKSWKKIGSLSFARSGVAAATVHDNAIIVIGGYTQGGSAANADLSSLTVVELGQAELLH